MYDEVLSIYQSDAEKIKKLKARVDDIFKGYNYDEILSDVTGLIEETHEKHTGHKSAIYMSEIKDMMETYIKIKEEHEDAEDVRILIGSSY